MPKRRYTLVGGLLVLIGLAVPAMTPADTGLRAELDGHPIPASEIGRYHCHDGRYPLVTCFHTEAEVQRDLSDIESGP